MGSPISFYKLIGKAIKKAVKEIPKNRPIYFVVESPHLSNRFHLSMLFENIFLNVVDTGLFVSDAIQFRQ